MRTKTNFSKYLDCFLSTKLSNYFYKHCWVLNVESCISSVLKPTAFINGKFSARKKCTTTIEAEFGGDEVGRILTEFKNDSVQVLFFLFQINKNDADFFFFFFSWKMRTKSKLLEVKGEVSTVRSAEHLRSIKSKVGLIFHRFGSGRLPKGANKCIDYRVISAELIGPELEHRLIQTEPPQVTTLKNRSLSILI